MSTPRTIKLTVGDRVRLKKQHPCGSWEWEVLRAGNDVKLKCVTCGRLIVLPRSYVARRVRGVTPYSEAR
jgi:hypothetical protein